jgi:hypothetical protein
MKQILILSIIALLIASCNSRSNSKIRSNQSIKVDKIYIGMTIQEMKGIYSNAEFIEEPLYLYGVDSEEPGITVVQNGEKMFFVWTMQNENTIHGISILSDKIQIDDGIHVGMTLEEFLKKHPGHELRMDELSQKDFEYIHIPELNYYVEFWTTDSTRVANYSKPDLNFISIKQPQAKIDRISLTK